MKPLYLEFVNTGIANRFDFGDYETIEMNWRLKMYPQIFYNALMHEIGHENGNNTLKDFWHDITAKTPGMFSFTRNHISSWTQFLPVYWSLRHKKIIYDWNRILDVIMIGSMAYAVYWLLILLGWML